MNTCDNIKVDLVGYCAGNGVNFTFDYGSRKIEAVPHKNYTHFDFIVTILVIMNLVLELKTEVCEIRVHLPAQVTAVKLQTEIFDSRVLGFRNLHKKVDESDNLSHVEKQNLFHMLSIYGAPNTSSLACVNYLSFNSNCRNSKGD